jgi:hypothetical protein
MSDLLDRTTLQDALTDPNGVFGGPGASSALEL